MDIDLLLQQPESRRDEAWERDFLAQFPAMKVEVASHTPQAGPDGFPYLLVKTGIAAEEPVAKVIEWLTGRGIGLVLNAHKMVPDYVFTYGMLWYFALTGRWQEDVTSERPAADVIYQRETGALAGPPAENYLPEGVRSVLREFLKAQGFSSPKILVVSSADFRQVDLIFSVESLGGIAQKDQRTFAEMLGWFLPPHYPLVLASEQGLPAFHPL